MLNPDIANLFLGDWLPDFCIKNSIAKLSVFGSALRDDFHEGSDIDLLVEYEPNINFGYLGMMRMQAELTDRFGKQVDLRTKAELSRIFRQRVVDEAAIQYVRQ